MISIFCMSAVLGPTGSAVASSALLDGVLTGPSPAGSGQVETWRVRIYLQDGAVRTEFEGASGQSGVILSLAERGNWWLSDDGKQALPVQDGAPKHLLINADDPCASMGGSARCERIQSRVIAGVLAQGWRYRQARGLGAGGSSRGELWVDSETGLVLAYRGHGRTRRERSSFQAGSVSYGPLSDSLFQLPEGAEHWMDQTGQHD